MSVEREILASVTNASTQRAAVVAVEGDSIWLYLTEPDGVGIAADCWLANTGTCLLSDDLRARVNEYRAQNEPLPAPSEMIVTDARAGLAIAAVRNVDFRWTADGDGVAVFLDGSLWGLIAPGERRGASRDLVAEGPWGAPLDPEVAWRILEGP